MRILGIAAVLLATILLAIPNIAKANEPEDTQIQINLNIKENINRLKSFSIFESSKVVETAQAAETSETPTPPETPTPEKTADQLRDEQLLSRWQKKQERLWQNLPQGKFAINASAYTAAADECGKSDGITASGVKVQEERTIACPPNFPFGAKLNIEGYGTYVCEDRGGAIKGNHIDIYMETKTQAFAFGRRNLTAEVVK